MPGKILLSTAYLPPTDYFSLISDAGEISVERKENYLKQSYRNRCYILSAHGPQMLSVPVYEATVHKVPLDEVRIDYSKRWQQVHLGAITASYRSSPYFDYYFDLVERVILQNHERLLSLNSALTELIMKILKIEKKISFTDKFMPPADDPNDFRYRLSPKKEPVVEQRRYLQVFDTGKGFIPHLSIVDLVFNMGPDSPEYL